MSKELFSDVAVKPVKEKTPREKYEEKPEDPDARVTTSGCTTKNCRGVAIVQPYNPTTEDGSGDPVSVCSTCGAIFTEWYAIEKILNVKKNQVVTRDLKDSIKEVIIERNKRGIKPVDPDPVDPVDPDPVDPVDPDPDPVDPGPVDPGPVDPGPVDPDPVDPVDPVDPKDPKDPDPVDPVDPVDPKVKSTK